ncbi:MAG: chromosomal replication initiator DnaA [Fusobacteriaceae bacterium]|nr:chromosomal replication initiator DnaA [Fusobacteriaceae bacterium]
MKETLYELETFDIDTNGELKKEIDLLEEKVKELITKGSKEIIIDKLPIVDIETKTIEIEGTGNFIGVKNSIINIPLEMIVFPFFTNQKQNRNVNFEYKFTDVGITMRSKLSPFKKDDKVNQPSLLEKKIYNFLIIMYEKNIENGLGTDYIEFEVSDFIENFLGNKMNSQYYVKVEQALKNLKYTQYEFLIDNHKKAGNLKFESPRFYLLDYAKIKFGKRISYRVTINSNIINKIIEKRYIKYDSKNLMEITDKDSVADRIYEFISMKRFNSDRGEEKLEVLAGIIPLQTAKINKRKNKDGQLIEYKTSNMSFVKKRIEKAFSVLVELDYIKEFKILETSEKRNTVEYIFNSSKDNVCHISSYLSNRKIENLEYKERKVGNDDTYEKMEEELIKAKRNVYFSKKYNDRSHSMFIKLCRENGEDFVVEVLKKIYKTLNQEIKKTLSAYVYGVIKNYKKDLDLGNVYTVGDKNISYEVKENVIGKKVENKIVEAVVVENEIKEDAKEINVEDTLLEIYMNFSQNKKEEIEGKARLLYQEDVGIPLNPINLKIFNNENVKKLYIRRVLKEMFGI